MPVRKVIKIYIKIHFPNTHIPILNLVHTPTHTLTRMSTHMLSVLRLLPTTLALPGHILAAGRPWVPACSEAGTGTGVIVPLADGVGSP